MSRWAGRALLAALALMFVLRLVQLGQKGLPRVGVPRGSLAPDFSGPLLGGGRFRLVEERGHPVVLVFWASWCGPCKHELPGVERVAQALRKPPHFARIFAINTEGDADTASAAARALGLRTLPIVLDDGSASQAYQVTTIPHTVILDGDGKVAVVMRGSVSEAELMHAIDGVELRTGDDP
jgi:thiol-disulfide isomerase/thioredoxin